MISGALVCLLGFASAPALPQPRGEMLLKPFDFHGVTLDDGELKRQFDEVRHDYLSIPNDDLLKVYRKAAGLPAPGLQFGGWWGDTGGSFSQIVSGLARMYAATGDPACREKADVLLSEWERCLSPDGSAVNTRGHYGYDKAVASLVDMYVYCGNRDALGYLSRVTDWAITHLGRDRLLGNNGEEWYTLGENLYRAYLATGDPKYRDFAKVWEYRAYWDLYAAGAGPLVTKPAAGIFPEFFHAYSHVNTLSSAAMAYRVTGDPYYLDVLRKAYDWLQANEVFATGGYGPWWEHLLPRDQFIASITGDRHDSFETQCGSWAAFKLSKYLISFTGEARYGDWIEALVYNGVGASIPMSPRGNVMYYSDYNVHGGMKRNREEEWTCCTGTRPLAVADYYDLIYLRAPEGLCVNLYTPSTVTWETGGQKVAVRQITRFPEEPGTEFIVSSKEPVEFSLKLRVPSWLSGPMTARVNGAAVEVKVDGHGWAVVRRQWHDGDRLSVNLPEAFHLSRLQPSSLAAIMYGPMVMAARSGGDPSSKIDFAHLSSAFTPVPGEALTYQLAADPDVLLRTFPSFREGEPYFLYLDTSRGR